MLNKLLMEYGLGGAAKEIEIGRAAAEAHRGRNPTDAQRQAANSQVNFCV